MNLLQIMEKFKKWNQKRKVTIVAEENILKPFFTTMDELIFIDQLLEYNPDFLLLFSKLSFLYNKFAIFK